MFGDHPNRKSIVLQKQHRNLDTHTMNHLNPAGSQANETDKLNPSFNANGVTST